MNKDSERAIAFALTIDCDSCGAKAGENCTMGGADMTRIVVALVRRLDPPRVDAAGWPLRDSPEATT